MVAEEKRVKELKSKFEKAYAQAYRFTYSKEDFLAARNTMEAAFHKFNEEVSNELLFKARVLQAEIFMSLGQNNKVKNIMQEIDNLSLTVVEKEILKEFSERLDEIRREMKQH
ncbi:hypothetical protein OCA22_30700 [Bacillus cereus]|nr:hypothetical protein [Bacillus cereus]